MNPAVIGLLGIGTLVFLVFFLKSILKWGLCAILAYFAWQAYKEKNTLKITVLVASILLLIIFPDIINIIFIGTIAFLSYYIYKNFYKKR